MNRPRLRSLIKGWVVVAAMGAAMPSAAEADIPVPAAFTQIYGVNTSDDSLSRALDLRLGAFEIVGPIGSPTPIGLAVRPSDGRLFVWDTATARVLVVDRCTGAGTPLGPSGLGSTPTIYELLFTTDGALLGFGDFLAFVDTSSGVVGTHFSVSFADGTAIPFLAGADYGPDGNLYVLVDNRTTFAPTVLGVLDLGSRIVTPIARLDLPDAEITQDILFDRDGRLYLSTLSGLYEIDLPSGHLDLRWQGLGPQGMSLGLPCENPCAGDPLGDGDGDEVCDSFDHCPTVPDPTNADDDGDGVGNPCDNCPAVYNPEQEPFFCDQVVHSLGVQFGGGSHQDAALVSWSVFAEFDVRGYNVIRIDNQGSRVHQNPVLIPCEECVSGRPASYNFLLPKHRSGRDLYVELVHRDGAIDTFGPATRR